MFAETESASASSIAELEVEAAEGGIDGLPLDEAECRKGASFVFEGDWKKHLASLKPIGLNALLNSHCVFSCAPSAGSFWPLENEPLHSLCPEFDSALSNSARDVFWHSLRQRRTPSAQQAQRQHYLAASHRFPGECFCALGQQIGFEADAIVGQKQFRTVKRLHLSYPTEKGDSMHMFSVLVDSGGGKRGASSLQLMTHGTDRYGSLCTITLNSTVASSVSHLKVQVLHHFYSACALFRFFRRPPQCACTSFGRESKTVS